MPWLVFSIGCREAFPHIRISFRADKNKERGRGHAETNSRLEGALKQRERMQRYRETAGLVSVGLSLRRDEGRHC